MKIDHLPLLCRSSAFDLTLTGQGVMMWMPGGIQEITPFQGGTGVPIQVMVDAQGAVEIERQRQLLAAKGEDPYFDFEHEDNGASFWAKQFFWSETPKPGIYARGEWTEDGNNGVAGKKWKKFSPVFHVDNKRARPARIVCKPDAHPNMGGLVNFAAFKQILPL